MKFHGIDAQGTLYDQRVPALPTWSNADLGRIVFLTTNDTVYIASSTGWVPLANVDAITAGVGISITKVSTPAQSVTISLADSFLASGRKLWIYEDTAPAGWSIVSGCSDGLLAVKGGTSDYNVAGGTALQGTWTQLSHSHSISVAAVADHAHSMAAHTHTTGNHILTVDEIPSHTHYAQAGGNRGGTAGGNDNFAVGNGPPFTFYQWICSSVGGSGYHSHPAGSGPSPADTSSAGAHTHTASENPVAPSPYWRPLANVGIIVQKV